MIRQLFTSHFTTIITMIGVSIGLGNVWRFPYMMGLYGGSAFLFLYLIFTLLFAIPALMAEWAFGRETRLGPAGAFSKVTGQVTGKIIGGLLLLTVIIADSYYLVVIGNVAFTSVFSLSTGFTKTSFSAYHSLLDNGWLQYLITLFLLIISLFVIHKGLNKGIEKASKIFVPFFLVTILYLIFHTFSLKGAPEQFLTFLQPDFNLINSKVAFAALGQAFFSLGLGGTFLLMYGSYMRDDQNIVKSAFLTGLGDVGAAVLASLFIVPAILVYQLDMASGPQLIFNTLPVLFSQMPGGQWIGGIFLLALTAVAFLSNLAALEVIAGGLNDFPGVNISRKKIIVMLGVLEAVLIFPSALNPAVVGYLDLIFGSGMQILGSVLVVIALTRGLGKLKTIKQIFNGKNTFLSRSYYYWVKWALPLALLMILISYIYDSF